MVQLYQPKSVARQAQSDRLFSGVWIRWGALTVGERFVCANILLIPVWWASGLYDYMPLLLLLGVAVYEWHKAGGLQLQRPILPVIASFAFGMYQLLRILIFYYQPRTTKFFGVVSLTLCPAFWLWYIQSNKIRIRLEVVAWACTVLVIQMIGFWLILEYVLPKSIFPIPSLLSLLTGKTTPIYLISPFRGDSFAIWRYTLFFVFPTFLSVVVGFIGLIALEIKPRLWSWLLLLACLFLLYLGSTRVVWVAFPLAIALRYLLINFGKRSGPPFIFALAAVTSFVTLSLPAITNFVLNEFNSSFQSINAVRAESSSTRFEIYRRTWEGIQENFLWGHLTTGAVVPNAEDYAVVGSHSVILGNLLYLNGFVGTAIFVVFWVSLLVWLYQTREGRPLACFCVWFLYTLVSPTLETAYTMPIASLVVLLAIAIRSPKLKSAPTKITFKRLHHA